MGVLSRRLAENDTVHKRKQEVVVNNVQLEEGTPRAEIHDQNPTEGTVQSKTDLHGRRSSQGRRAVLAQQQL